jgi:small subunit ribosomal protein S20
VRQNLKRRTRNRAHRTEVRHEIKVARTALQGQDAAAADAAVKKACRAADKMATKGVIHPRKAARLKSRLSRQANALRAKGPAQPNANA